MNSMRLIIYIIWIPGRRKSEKGSEKLFEKIIVENFPNVGKETDIQSRKHRELQAR